ncbi:efflux RND transporter permease subunit [Planctomicrobium sp. SH664]|uniref:efflux RND transporter permease subunit n=1 Tax=Planctomicrobium sp. SH664 TaxID=3448125 RepID=UPI003F5AEA6E
MLNALIRFSLKFRLLTAALSLILMGIGTWLALKMPIEVFPDLDRPRVVVMTEAPGLAPEEVETLITFPIETALNGANHVQAVRSSSASGLSVITVDFDWGSDLYVDRQVVTERLQMVQDRLPPGVRPALAPISSVMGQVLVLAMWSDGQQTSPMELRTLADWVVRQRLLTIPGISQIFTMGGQRMQYQVQVDPDAMTRFGVTLDQVRTALGRSNENATGGYLDQQGPEELLVRSLGRFSNLDDIRNVVVAIHAGQPIALAQIATIEEGAQVKRGDSGAFIRDGESIAGGDAVVLTISKQPSTDTRALTKQILDVVERELGPSLPAGVRIVPVYSQSTFIDRAIENVLAALRDGGVLVVIILFVFLMNLRTTFITLTAIPLSLAITAIVFAIFGFSINTMTLGGLAVAIGELVDDAIVDVENIFRRLKENRHAAVPRSPLLVVYEASAEIRNSIVFSTMIVVLVFVPLFALSGVEGRLFAPMGIAYIVSILASLLVSLTITPVLSYWLLGSSSKEGTEVDGPVLRGLKFVGEGVIRFSLKFPWLTLGATAAGVFLAAIFMSQMDRDFLPPFNEGAIQLNVLLPPGTSLATSNQINRSVEAELKKIPDVIRSVRRTGRAELDEHAEAVSNSEYILELDPASHNSREAQLNAIREGMANIPGIVTAVEQPLAHLISHMISGVKAQVGIKIFGTDLDELRRIAQRMEGAIRDVPGVKDLLIEPQVTIPQLRIELDSARLLQYGLTAADVNEFIETALNGLTVSEILQGQRTFDVVVRLNESAREDLSTLKRLTIELPDGGRVPLESVAQIYESGGPNVINREKVQRRIVLQCNVAGRGLVDVVNDLRVKLRPIQEQMPPGYYIEFGGQFESQQSASRVISVLFLCSLIGVFLVLFTMFKSVNLSLQVMAALPMAFIGSVAALVLTGQTLTIASMVGFISLGGIASRNGILLLNHYLHLVRYEGESVTHEMILRAGKERLAPVLMTALTSGIGLVPLVLTAEQPGKEILYPVATVILGGLISSTLLDFFVHPALFWLFGRTAAERAISSMNEAEELA